MKGQVSKWGTALKIFLYMFDVVSDWVNGILLIIGNGNHPNGDDVLANHTNNGTDPCNSSDDGKPHVAWGGMTVGFSWLPAVFGLVFLVWAAIDRSIKNWLLIPLRFLLWPLLVPISM